jgi:iron complex transport system ATP-binding protein
VLHEITIALHADALVVMRDGRITHHGPTHDPVTHEAVKSAFDHRIAIHAVGDQWVALPQTLRTQNFYEN